MRSIYLSYQIKNAPIGLCTRFLDSIWQCHNKYRNKTVFVDYLRTGKNDLRQTGSTVTLSQFTHTNIAISNNANFINSI